MEEAYSENRGETLDKRSVQIYGKREPAFSLRMVACSVSNPNDMNIMNILVYGQGFLSIFLSLSLSLLFVQYNGIFLANIVTRQLNHTPIN